METPVGSPACTSTLRRQWTSQTISPANRQLSKSCKTIRKQAPTYFYKSLVAHLRREGITDLFGSFPLDFGGPDSFPECAVAPEDPQIEENSASGGSSSISASSTTRFVFSEEVAEKFLPIHCK